ncbi:2S albumin-like [Vigna radiata var. radiata]|uniref:2S albumin-like n=1 Tax=Vigna radiata var. radiata TaxID=3916 RepID=A0A1S3VUC6_VIGRR|nr:2S albumin-like [Vigna radiata var. radiata]
MSTSTILIVALVFVGHTCCAFKGTQERLNCLEQIKKAELEYCENYLMTKIQDHHDDVIRSVRMNDGFSEAKELHEMLRCCQEVRGMSNPKCQCQALQHIMEGQVDKPKKEKLQMEEALLNLFVSCNFGPMECDLHLDSEREMQ